MYGGHQIPALGMRLRLDAPPGGKAFPVLVVERDTRPPPEVPVDLGRHFEDHELVRPRGEPAITAERLNLAADRQYGVRSGLVRNVVQLRADEPQPGRPPSDLRPRGSQQNLVQVSARKLTPMSSTAEIANPGTVLQGHLWRDDPHL